ncbi:hypothetical protein [Humidisolicoccus flavus]|uniref:hypothetical protein n=1 Tax=Humidisolicoccus flavus TaxID=3111414 RepID=UPI0032510991
MDQDFGHPRLRGGSSSQTAARLLILLDVLGMPVGDPPPVPGAVRAISSLTRLEKLDFWMRNPDYLADELLTDHLEGRLPRQTIEVHVSRMLSLAATGHHYPMIRFKYGAYEQVDDALAKLKSTGLIEHRRSADAGDRARRDYFLLEEGERVVAQMRTTLPQLQWYDEQAEAIALLAEAAMGSTARQRQYEQPEYRGARIGTEIPAIFERVAERARELSFSIESASGEGEEK